MSVAGRLAGRVCVVTGASGGIGAATVALFEREGATRGRRRCAARRAG